MKVKTAEIERRVIALLDENEEILEERMAYGDPETELMSLIRSLIPDAARIVLASAPAASLSESQTIPATGLLHTEGNRALLPLPEKFLRLVYFRMSDWKRGIVSTLALDSEEYSLRFPGDGIRYARRRAGAAAVVWYAGRRYLEIFNTGSRSTVASATCLLVPEIKNGVIDLPQSTVFDVVRKTAEMVNLVITR